MKKQWLNPDGTVAASALEEIEGIIADLTDKVGGLMDRVAQKGFVPFFRCSHSGLLLPGDYAKQWGRDYGIGMGPTPVSEVLDSNYHLMPPGITSETLGSFEIEQLMHPVDVTGAQIDWVMAHPKEGASQLAVMAKDDSRCKKRGKIIFDRQMKNKASKLPMLVSMLQKGTL